jgi:nucleotide-binding universal stress UspA family protein
MMMIKDIVVTLGLGERDPAGDFAVSVAEAFEAHLVGVAVTYAPIVPGALFAVPAQFIESQRAEAVKAVTAARARFESAVRTAGVSAEVRTIDGSISEAANQIAQMARRFDLAIVAQPDRKAAYEIVGETVLFDSGRPTLMVPFVQKAGLKLGRVLVCWDGSRAASRAVADALPFLKRAGDIDVLIVAGDRGKSDEVPGADLGQHLARHGLKINVRRITSPDIGIAETILSTAADSSADLLVMGGYGHSRLREFVLGGVTESIIGAMTVPTLLSH